MDHDVARAAAENFLFKLGVPSSEVELASTGDVKDVPLPSLQFAPCAVAIDLDDPTMLRIDPLLLHALDRERLAGNPVDTDALADAVAARLSPTLLAKAAASSAGRNSDSPQAGYLSASDIARELGISRAEAYRLVRQMFALREGRVVRVSRRAFDRWVTEHTRAPWETAMSMSEAVAGGGSSREKEARPSGKVSGFEPPRQRPRPSNAGSKSSVGNVQPTQPRRRRG